MLELEIERVRLCRAKATHPSAVPIFAVLERQEGPWKEMRDRELHRAPGMQVCSVINHVVVVGQTRRDSAEREI